MEEVERLFAVAEKVRSESARPGDLPVRLAYDAVFDYLKDNNIRNYKMFQRYHDFSNSRSRNTWALKNYPHDVYLLLKEHEDDIVVHRTILSRIKNDFIPSLIKVANDELEHGNKDAADEISMNLRDVGIIDNDLEIIRKILMESLIGGKVYRAYVDRLRDLQRRMLDAVASVAMLSPEIPLPKSILEAMSDIAGMGPSMPIQEHELASRVYFSTPDFSSLKIEQPVGRIYRTTH